MHSIRTYLLSTYGGPGDSIVRRKKKKQTKILALARAFLLLGETENCVICQMEENKAGKEYKRGDGGNNVILSYSQGSLTEKMTFGSRSQGEGASRVDVWGESVTGRKDQCKGLSPCPPPPPASWRSGPEAIAAEVGQARGEWGCQAMQGCSRGFGFARSDMEVCTPHHIHRRS